MNKQTMEGMEGRRKVSNTESHHENNPMDTVGSSNAFLHIHTEIWS